MTIIAIDGPAGSGKSTVSKLLAKKLSLLYIDTGAMYRALTLKAMNKDASLDDAEALVALARSSKIDLEDDGGILKVLLDGRDVAGAIRTLEVTQNVKFIARVPGVREEMVKIQRAIAENKGAVLEGRDIGTVVFPNARFKFYLDADPETRVERRFRELTADGQRVERSTVRDDVTARDSSDKSRSAGPLKKADDAVYINTTALTVEEVVDIMFSHIKEHKEQGA